MDPSESLSIVGIDLAWGESNPDGITRLEFENGIRSAPTLLETSLVRGEEELLARVQSTPCRQQFVAIDAPTICRNETGARPVDLECSRIFRKEEAGCHPVNRRLCQRPFRIAGALAGAGYALTAALAETRRQVAEVYPHPAMIRLFGLSKTIKYKRGPVAGRRNEFQRYQDCFRRFLKTHFAVILEEREVQRLLSLPWKKDHEDELDSLFCAVIGWWHVSHGGAASEILGDAESGQILIPSALPA